MAVRVFHTDEATVRLPMIASDARLVVWPGVGAQTANMNYVAMQPGEENQVHQHPVSEDTIYVLSGRGTIADVSNELVHEFVAGQVIHVPPGVEHQVRGDRGQPITSVGGPTPPDLAMLRRAGVL
jgi:quercetin dioxygenase-like cupin family protein